MCLYFSRGPELVSLPRFHTIRRSRAPQCRIYRQVLGVGAALVVPANFSLFSGICGNTSSSINCASGIGQSVTELAPTLFPGNKDNNTLSVLQFALIIQNKIIVPVIIAGGVLFLLGFLSLQYLKRKEQRMLDPYKANGASNSLHRLSFLTIFLLWLSAMFAFGASLSSNIGTAALAFITDNFGT